MVFILSSVHGDNVEYPTAEVICSLMAPKRRFSPKFARTCIADIDGMSVQVTWSNNNVEDLEPRKEDPGQDALKATQEGLVVWQQNDPTLAKARELTHPGVTQSAYFNLENGLLYRQRHHKKQM